MALLSVLTLSVVTSTLAADVTPPDKSQYTLFNPTPADSMRPWRTDRAGVSPYTIDAGHFEVDFTPVSYAYDEFQVLIATPFSFNRAKFTSDAWVYGATQVKLGLANKLDVAVSVIPYETITVGPSRLTFGSSGRPIRRTTLSGFGDVTSSLRLNIWGNDGGCTALSVSGNVKFPTANSELGNGQFEGGPSIEFAAQLPWGFELRIDGAANLFEDNRNNRQAAIESLLSLSHRIIGHLEGYAAFETIAFTSGEDWAGSLKAGLNYRMTKDIELYVGNFFGVTDSAVDYNPFVGVAARF